MARAPNFHVILVDVVVTARSHNPTILNPDFIKKHEIVPSNWKHSETITTPPLSFVRYPNGISITVEEQKLRVVEPVRGKFLEKNQVCKIAARYVQALPEVNYTALGFNWEIAFPKRAPKKWLRERFLVPGKWQKDPCKLLYNNLTVSFSAGEFINNLTLAPARFLMPEGKKKEAILIKSNFHHSDVTTPDEVSRLADKWNGQQEVLKAQLRSLFMGRDLP